MTMKVTRHWWSTALSYKPTEYILFSVISQLQNKSQNAFHQWNAFNVKLQL